MNRKSPSVVSLSEGDQATQRLIPGTFHSCGAAARGRCAALQLDVEAVTLPGAPVVVHAQPLIPFIVVLEEFGGDFSRLFGGAAVNLGADATPRPTVGNVGGEGLTSRWASVPETMWFSSSRTVSQATPIEGGSNC